MLTIMSAIVERAPRVLPSPGKKTRKGTGISTTNMIASAREEKRAFLTGDEVQRASLVAFYLPMHTATRLAIPLIERVLAGELDVRIHDVLPLDEAAEAHRLLEGRRTSGKLLLRT